MTFSNRVSYIHNLQVRHYCLEAPFDPPEAYPELASMGETNEANLVYPMVRDLLQQLGLDHENIGTAKWNPFADIIGPGDKVLIKPNLVTHEHFLGREALYSTVVHGSVIRPVIDYVYKALQGRGSVIIADNPLERADFQSLMEFTGIQQLVDKLVQRGYRGLEVIDLRPRILKEDRRGNFYHERLPGDPLGYVDVDLGKDSLFAEFDDDPDVHYYTLADPTVDHMDPKCVRESLTDKYHNSSTHTYIVSKTILDADVIINVAKLKSHCKAGVSLTLKNMIGMVYQKDCMPHHRPGPPPKGDSFPQYPASHYVASRKLYRTLRKWFHIHRVPGFRSFRNILQKNKILIGQHTEHGNWKGNDTIWRTVLDLNRIAAYADKAGKMQDTPQRRQFGLVDGIVSQQGEGPMAGKSVPTSIIVGGLNPVLVDALAVKAVGLDYRLFKSVARAPGIDRWKLMGDSEPDLSFPDIELPNIGFELPRGWR
ncbi:MAG: DUF362 domain-containing protein [Planctomycetota bacterium]